MQRTYDFNSVQKCNPDFAILTPIYEINLETKAKAGGATYYVIKYDPTKF